MDEGEKEWGKGGRDDCKRRKRREEDGRASLGMDEKEEKNKVDERRQEIDGANNKLSVYR